MQARQQLEWLEAPLRPDSADDLISTETEIMATITRLEWELYGPMQRALTPIPSAEPKREVPPTNLEPDTRNPEPGTFPSKEPR